jgi:hypothetical protein
MSRFLVPSLDRGGISPYAISGGPVLWLQARPQYLGTTGSRTFDGAGQNISIDDIDPETSDFAIVAWVAVDATATDKTIIYTGGDADNQQGVWLYIDDDEKVALGFCDTVKAGVGSGRATGVLSDAALNTDWHLVIVNFDRDGDATCWIDGSVQTATVDISGNAATLGCDTGNCCIGANAGAGDWYDGNLSKMAYLDELTDSDDRTELRNSGDGKVRAQYSAGLAAKTVHSWNCNEGPDSDFYDSTGTNDGTALPEGSGPGSAAGPEATDYQTPGDGDTIVSWTCRATGAVFSQDTAASRPIYRAPGSAIGNAFGGLEFDGSDDFLKRTVANWLSSSSSGLIVAVVENDDTGQGYFFSSGDNATDTRLLAFGLTDNLFTFQRSGDIADSVSGLSGAAGKQVIACGSTGTGYSLWANGATLSISVQGGADTGDWFADTVARDHVVVGAWLTTRTITPFDGIISEILVFDGTVSAAERTALFQRLASHYGITLS